MSVLKILVMGLPGSGKTTLSRLLAKRLAAVHFNADEVRARLNTDLGFSPADRIEQAARMGFLCDVVARAGKRVIADFVCPTAQTREAFGEAFVVWVDRIDAGRFEDTNRLFVPPAHYDFRVGPQGTPDYWAAEIAKAVAPRRRRPREGLATRPPRVSREDRAV